MATSIVATSINDCRHHGLHRPNKFATCDAAHTEPPRGVSTCIRSSSNAIPRSVITPRAWIECTTGRTRSANASALQFIDRPLHRTWRWPRRCLERARRTRLKNSRTVIRHHHIPPIGERDHRPGARMSLAALRLRRSECRAVPIGDHSRNCVSCLLGDVAQIRPIERVRWDSFLGIRPSPSPAHPAPSISRPDATSIRSLRRRARSGRTARPGQRCRR